MFAIKVRAMRIRYVVNQWRHSIARRRGGGGLWLDSEMEKVWRRGMAMPESFSDMSSSIWVHMEPLDEVEETGRESSLGMVALESSNGLGDEENSRAV